MSNQLVLITGCRFSGSAQLCAALATRPGVHALAEADYRNEQLPAYMSDPAFHPRVAFELPMFAPAVDSFAQLDRLRILWSISDPRSVVAGMLQPDSAADGLSWAQRREGAELEIRQALPLLTPAALQGLQPWLAAFQETIALDPVRRPRDAAVDTAALCWWVKNSLLAVYQGRGVSHYVVQREALAQQTLPVLDRCMAYIDTASDAMSGQSAGRATEVERPWNGRLSDAELERIDRLCGGLASACGYATAS